MHKYLCLLVMGAGIVLGSRPALAQIINYTLSGVTFAGGGTATGGFSWDSGLNAVTSGSITFDGTTDTFHRGIRTYSVLTSVSYAGNQFIRGVSAGNRLDFAFEATDLGVSGPHLITVGRAVSSSPSVGLASTEFGWFAHNIFDPVTAGGVVVLSPVPEPETYAMLLAGLGLLGFAARRRKLKEIAAA